MTQRIDIDTMEGLSEVPCPSCGEKGGLTIVWRLKAVDPLASLAGMQMKVSARDWPYLVCPCGYVEAAKWEQDDG